MDGNSHTRNEIATDVLPPVTSKGRYTEFFVGMHGALLTEMPELGAAIDRFAHDTPATHGKAAWGYDIEQAKGWFQIAAGSTEDERAAAVAAFDEDMRRRGLVPIAPAFLR